MKYQVCPRKLISLLVFTVLLIFLIYFQELVSRTCSSQKLDIKFGSLNIYVLKFNDSGLTSILLVLNIGSLFLNKTWWKPDLKTKSSLGLIDLDPIIKVTVEHCGAKVFCRLLLLVLVFFFFFNNVKLLLYILAIFCSIL